jgi:hypothetical protein
MPRNSEISPPKKKKNQKQNRSWHLTSRTLKEIVGASNKKKKRTRNKLKRDFKCHKTPVVQRQQLLTRSLSLSLSLYLLETHYNYYNHCCCFAAAAAATASRSTRTKKSSPATSKDGGRRQKTTDDDDNAVRTKRT